MATQLKGVQENAYSYNTTLSIALINNPNEKEEPSALPVTLGIYESMRRRAAGSMQHDNARPLCQPSISHKVCNRSNIHPLAASTQH
eukprot:329247-Pelagomonas_calceolata.AAC.5